MFDAVPQTPALQRAQGRGHVALLHDAGRTRLSGLHQSGCAKAFLPRIHDSVPEVVFLNTAGGLASGDKISFAIDLGAGAQVTATTQTAERAYRAEGAAAEVSVRLQLGQGAEAHWLPQETILYDRAALKRRTRIELEGEGRVMLCEMLVLGRAAMGETVADLSLSDRREVWSRGLPVWIDAFGLDAQALAQRPALLGGARAIATIALVAPGGEDAVGAARATLTELADVSGHASGWDGKCVIRISAGDSFVLKRAVARLLTTLRRGAALPRVWQI